MQFVRRVLTGWYSPKTLVALSTMGAAGGTYMAATSESIDRTDKICNFVMWPTGCASLGASVWVTAPALVACIASLVAYTSARDVYADYVVEQSDARDAK
jgi:hypothetical protein